MIGRRPPLGIFPGTFFFFQIDYEPQGGAAGNEKREEPVERRYFAIADTDTDG